MILRIVLFSFSGFELLAGAVWSSAAPLLTASLAGENNSRLIARTAVPQSIEVLSIAQASSNGHRSPWDTGDERKMASSGGSSRKRLLSLTGAILCFRAEWAFCGDSVGLLLFPGFFKKPHRPSKGSYRRELTAHHHVRHGDFLPGVRAAPDNRARGYILVHILSWSASQHAGDLPFINWENGVHGAVRAIFKWFFASCASAPNFC